MACGVTQILQHDVVLHVTAPSGGQVNAARVLLLPGFVQNQRAFENCRRSLPAWLSAQGYEVWVAQRRPGIDLAGYVRLVERCVDRASGRPLALVGHSMGGVAALCLDDQRRQAVSAIATIGTPLLPGLARFVGRRPLEGALLRASRQLGRRGVMFPSSVVARGLKLLSPVLDAPFARYPLQPWAPGGLEPDALREFLEQSFVPDGFGLLGDVVEMSRTCAERAGPLDVAARYAAPQPPVLLVGGDLDALAPPAAVAALHDALSSKEKRLVQFSKRTCGVHFGHVDLLVGRHAEPIVWPVLETFLGAHLGDATKATAV